MALQNRCSQADWCNLALDPMRLEIHLALTRGAEHPIQLLPKTRKL